MSRNRMNDSALAVGSEFNRFVVVGLVATGVHFGMFLIGYHWIGLPSAALANIIAVVFGIATSFTGNRLFVFRHARGHPLGDAGRFLGLYGTVAFGHAAFLGGWTDLAGLDPHWGFLIATGIQVACTFLGNKYLVFVK